MGRCSKRFFCRDLPLRNWDIATVSVVVICHASHGRRRMFRIPTRDTNVNRVGKHYLSPYLCVVLEKIEEVNK